MTNFRVWENECDKFMLKKYGVGVDDLPDMEWEYWHKDGLTPKEAVKKAIDKVNSKDGWW
jgi:hypothetical protein